MSAPCVAVSWCTVCFCLYCLCLPTAHEYRREQGRRHDTPSKSVLIEIAFSVYSAESQLILPNHMRLFLERFGGVMINLPAVELRCPKVFKNHPSSLYLFFARIILLFNFYVLCQSLALHHTPVHYNVIFLTTHIPPLSLSQGGPDSIHDLQAYSHMHQLIVPCLRY